MALATLPPCPLENMTSYNCENPYPNCINPLGFQFSTLWNITQAVALCPSDTRLAQPYNPAHPSLTQHSCQLFVNGNPYADTWTRYPTIDIYGRLTAWKFPLLQLVFVFPRPPLSILAGLFVILHVLGDPISTISDTLLRLASCRGRARFWRRHFDEGEALYQLIRKANRPGDDPFNDSRGFILLIYD